MSDEHQRLLSALVDDALDERSTAGLCNRLQLDPALRGTWERYHLMGRAMRRERVDAGARGIAERVAAALDAAPDLRAVPAPPRRRVFAAPFAGAALAAAAAFIAVFAVPSFFQWPDAADPGSGLAASVAPGQPADAERWGLVRPELASKLDLFLLNHQESAPATGVKGVLPYVAFVGYDGPR